MARRRGPQGAVWTGAVGILPSYVTGEGEPFRPALLVWFDAAGMVLGSSVVRPEQVVAEAAASLAETMRRPMLGEPHRPVRLRIADPEIGAALRRAHPTIAFEVGPTVEADEWLLGLVQHFSDADPDDDDAQGFLAGANHSESAVASFFRASAALFRRAPWSIVATDEDFLLVSCEALGLQDVVVVVIGQNGESLGLVVFQDVADYEQFVESVGDLEEGDEVPDMPSYLSLNFERGADLPAAIRKEIAEHRWEVAGPNAFPWPVYLDEDMVARPASPRELVQLDVLARALVEVLLQPEPLLKAWQDGEPSERTVTVTSQSVNYQVTLRTLPGLPQVTYADPLLAELANLDLDNEDDRQRSEALYDALGQRFRAAAESRPIAQPQHWRMVADVALTYLDITLATIEPSDLQELLFRVIPRQVNIAAADAASVLTELDALFGFLDRECALPQAAECRTYVARQDLAKLTSVWSDPRNFGPAKTLLLEAVAAGVDTTSPAALMAWAEKRNRQLAGAKRGGNAGARGGAHKGVGARKTTGGGPRKSPKPKR